jgi:hypothetical protein
VWKFAAICRLRTPAVAAICRIRSLISSHFNFHLLPARFFAIGLYCLVMTETAQPKRGGKAFHSILEPHFDFIHQQRQRRKTWKEIAKSLLTEKGITVTLYAPYRFYRRKLKRAVKPHWESKAAIEQPATVNPSASTPQTTTTETDNPYRFNTNI